MSAPRAVCTQKKVFSRQASASHDQIYFASCFQSPSAIIPFTEFMGIFFVQNVFFQAMHQLMLVGSMATAWTGESASSASVTENSAKLSPIKSGTGIAQMIRLPNLMLNYIIYREVSFHHLWSQLRVNVMPPARVERQSQAQAMSI